MVCFAWFQFALAGLATLYDEAHNCMPDSEAERAAQYLRPCYRDKWVSGKTDFTLHALLLEPVKLLFTYHLSLCFPLCLQEVVIHGGGGGEDGINLGDLECLVADCSRVWEEKTGD